MRTRIKICGITRVEDALSAIEAGADAIGLVFYPPSPRGVTPEQAAEIVASLPPFVTVVGLFVNADREEIERVLSITRLDLLQFHGDESVEDCAGFGRPYIKAVRMRDDVDLVKIRSRYKEASALLLDAYQKGVPGGTGSAFDWDRIPEALAGDIVLAGGLSPQNVEQAVQSVHPYAVDVSGGVEKEEGIKDADKIVAFIRGVESANQ
ncbi:MAG: phosphoribosylanthranilate isomerase [Gammaproteobacteria bacterium]|nr:phosphoribosylanthranilate isomerase [Gammaproteobacteria bacterium]